MIGSDERRLKEESFLLRPNGQCLCERPLSSSSRVVRCPYMELERDLLVTLVVGCNLFAEALFESSASLSEVGFLAVALAAWDLVDDAVLRGES